MTTGTNGRTKRCPKCKTTKHVKDFCKDKTRRDGLSIWCRECASSNVRRWRASDRGRTYNDERYEQNCASDKSRANRLYRAARRRARIKGLEFSLVEEWVHERLRIGICQATGWKLSLDRPSSNRTNPLAPSLDRYDNSQGYTPENCWIVCWAYNQMKNENGEDLILQVSEAIKKRRTKGNSKVPKGETRREEGKEIKGRCRGSRKRQPI